MDDNNSSINAVGGPDVIQNYISVNRLLDPSLQTIQQILNHFNLRPEYFETIRSYINEIRNEDLELMENMPRRRRGRRAKNLNDAREPLGNMPLGHMRLRPRERGRPSEQFIEIREPLENVPQLQPRGRGRPRKNLIENRASLGNMQLRPPEPLIKIREPLGNVQRRRGRPRKLSIENIALLENIEQRPPELLIENMESMENMPRRSRGRRRVRRNSPLNDSQPTLLSIEDDQAPIQVAPTSKIVWIVTSSKKKAC